MQNSLYLLYILYQLCGLLVQCKDCLAFSCTLDGLVKLLYLNVNWACYMSLAIHPS